MPPDHPQRLKRDYCSPLQIRIERDMKQRLHRLADFNRLNYADLIMMLLEHSLSDAEQHGLRIKPTIRPPLRKLDF
jgi:hypothetical protein